MDKECLKQMLIDVGCDDEVMKKILNRLNSGNVKELLNLLKKEKCHVMDEYHESVRKVDCMDFMIRKIEKEINQ